MDNPTRLRRRIITLLHEYLEEEARTRELERKYKSFVLYPTETLERVTESRKRLEVQYAVLVEHIENRTLTDQAEIDQAVEIALNEFDLSICAMAQSELTPPGFNSEYGTNTLDDIPLTPDEKGSLLRTFKKIVLPRVHSDTSDSPFELFHAAFQAYSAKDYLLIAAFIAAFTTEEEFRNFKTEFYKQVSPGLIRRIDELRLLNIPDAFTDKTEIIKHLQKQNVLIRKRVNAEVAKIKDLKDAFKTLKSFQATNERIQ